MEAAVTPRPDIRRNAFGAIDFDHYRRVAAQVRTETLRQAFSGVSRALGSAAALLVARLSRLPSLSLPRSLAGRPLH